MKTFLMCLCILGALELSARGGTVAVSDALEKSELAPMTITSEADGYTHPSSPMARPEAASPEVVSPDVAAAINGTVAGGDNGVSPSNCMFNCGVPEPVPMSLLPSGLLALYLVRRFVRLTNQ